MAQDGGDRAGYRARVRGCLLGGALGDALGAPVEFDTLGAIRAAHGPAGVRSHADPRALVTDDTQMTLWTVEGLLRARSRQAVRGGQLAPVPAVHDAYLRWYHTQHSGAPAGGYDGWLAGRDWLHARRAPGNTCLTALSEAARGHQARGEAAANASKGCGGVMRSAPFGLLPEHAATDEQVFTWAEQAAGLTHGHPTGRLASGATALLVRRLVAGDGLDAALDAALAALRTRPGHEETTKALLAARDAAADGEPGAEAVESLGAGWVAEEALAIAVYAALAHPAPDEFADALALAVTHSGDSDSTGAVCGNLLGARHGEAALPRTLADPVEGRDDLLALADDLVTAFTTEDPAAAPGWLDRYPQA
ncbi:ADP-ribosylglycohydrolase family protein [Thermobifida cellulosilytica]|uniref:ADP-ribosylglycohydrolase n=1 Tax=Thermobifida cellulosilytica TB100 TaxID=665004 RepID=A0A147KFI3_THECS|nr:ADP-ribosylglycohydrolase family protein [Thermobifida cellulosilytica]KUP96037.1 ADP-ribosylglycohydrolase [Thermobifida cellulosilytica TB100]